MNKVDINVTDPDWERWVAEMYLCVRKYDCSIPDNVLEQMRYILKQYAPVEQEVVEDLFRAMLTEELFEMARKGSEMPLNATPEDMESYREWE